MAERWHTRLSQAAAARAARPAAAHPVRRASALPADQHPRRDRRRHRRRDREAIAPDHPAVCGRAGGNRSRARPRAGPRVSVRHRVADRRPAAGRSGRASGAAAVVHRRHGRVPVARSDRFEHRDVGARSRVARRHAVDRQARRSRISFPYRYGHAFWAYVAGRWGDRAVGDCCAAAGPDGNIKAAIAAVLGVDDEAADHGVARGDQAAFARGLRDRAAGDGIWPLVDLARAAAAATSTWRRRSAPTARASCSCRRSRCSRSTCTWPTSRPAGSCASSSNRRAIRISTACSSSSRPATGRPTIAVSCSRRCMPGQPVLTIVDATAAIAKPSTSSRTSARSTIRRGRRTGKQIAFSALKGGVLDLFVYTLETRRAAAADRRSICRSRSRVVA